MDMEALLQAEEQERYEMLRNRDVLWRHFKGELYKVSCVAHHTERKEDLVIYRKYDKKEKKLKSYTYARPLKIFLSPVDIEKYPDSTQVYRFEPEVMKNELFF